MGSYVGIDAHSNAGLELAVIDSKEGGDLLWRDRCPLDGRLLTEAVARAPRPCTVVFEQGELATWLSLTLSGTCDRTIAADPRCNRLIATSPDKHDAFDALTLAELARGRYVREVYQPPESFTDLRLRVRHHYRLGCHVTALKNQVKALFRQHGIPVAGTSVFTPSRRDGWLAALPKAARLAAEDLYALLDVAVDRKQGALNCLTRSARKVAPVRRFLDIPQIGPVTAATFAAYIVTPERFRSRKHLWSYCGFGLTRRATGNRSEPVRLRKRCNHHVKRVIKSAVERMIARGDQPFVAAYDIRLERGTLRRRAKLSVARKLIEVMSAMWTNEEDYDPERVTIS